MCIQFMQFIRAGFDDGRIDSAGHFGGRGAFAGAEWEDVDFGKSNFGGGLHGFGEVIVGLAGEADDDVGGDGGAVEDGVNLTNNTEKVVSGILATHFS